MFVIANLVEVGTREKNHHSSVVFTATGEERAY